MTVEYAYDLACVVDVKGSRRRCAGYLDRRKHAITVQESLVGDRDVEVPDDLSRVVDATSVCKKSLGQVDGCETAITVEEPTRGIGVTGTALRTGGRSP